MTKSASPGISVRYFLGCPFTPDLRIHLDHNEQWKIASLDKSPGNLTIVHHQERDYIGLYLEGSEFLYQTLEEAEATARSNLEKYLDPISVRAVEFKIFPLVFIA